MIKQNAVKIDGKVIADKDEAIANGTYVFQVGKRRFARITLK